MSHREYIEPLRHRRVRSRPRLLAPATAKSRTELGWWDHCEGFIEGVFPIVKIIPAVERATRDLIQVVHILPFDMIDGSLATATVQ